MEGLTQAGRLLPGRSGVAPRLGVGLEKLDRNLYDPSKAFEYIEKLGVKWVRVQSGWARTETVKGVYNFEWLDAVIDPLLDRGLTPWVCLCYGNGLYTPAAKAVFGAVGCPPIATNEEREGWDAYVRAIAAHYRGRITHYEIWNEPDGLWCWKHGVNASEYGAFAARTARALKETEPSLFVIGGAVCGANLPYIREAMDAGMAEAIDGLSFHRYSPDENAIITDAAALRALLDDCRPGIALIQGESGGQSSSLGAGAMAGGAWTPLRQAKHLLRQRVTDLSLPLMFTSHFSMTDMAEALNGLNADRASYKDYGYFGLLGARFDEEGRGTGEYKSKPAYFAYRHLIAALGDAEVVPCELPIRRLTLPSPSLLGSDCDAPISAYGFRRGSHRALAYWRPAPLLTDTYEGTVSFQCAGLRGAPLLADLLNGDVSALSESMNRLQNGAGELCGLPLRDYPLLLMEEGFLI